MKIKKLYQLLMGVLILWILLVNPAFAQNESSSAGVGGWTTNWNGIKSPIRFGGICSPKSGVSWSVGGRGQVIHRIVGENNIIFVKEYRLPDENTWEDLIGVWFDVSGVGWVVGANGQIFHTADTGKSWKKQDSGTTEDLTDIVCVDTDNCWVIGGQWVISEGILISTKDGGKTWEKLDDISGRMIEFISLRHGWIVDSNLIYRTVDGGKSWSKTIIDPVVDKNGDFLKEDWGSVNYTTLKFLTTEVGWVAGSNRVARTEDGGKTWKVSEVDSYLKASIVGIVAYGEKKALAVNRGEWNYCTEDSGKTWNKCFRRNDIDNK